MFFLDIACRLGSVDEKGWEGISVLSMLMYLTLDRPKRSGKGREGSALYT